jgi:hypothetical protein
MFAHYSAYFHRYNCHIVAKMYLFEKCCREKKEFKIKGSHELKKLSKHWESYT